MTLKKVFFSSLLILVFSLQSCQLEDDTVNFHFLPLQILSAELPETFELNKTYEIKVTYNKPNNCTFFEGFEITRSGTTERNVVAVGSELEDEECVDIAGEAVAYFDFICYYSETYVFRFYTGEDEEGESQFLEYEVPVSP